MIYNYGDFYLEAEYILGDIESEPNGGVLHSGEFENIRSFYIMGAYTFKERFTPFVRFERLISNMENSFGSEQNFIFGLNFAITHSIYLKSEVHLPEITESAILDDSRIIFSLAVAF